MSFFLGYNLTMDIISKVRVQITDWELSHKVFSEALGFKVISHSKTISKYEMNSHAQVITAIKSDIYDSKPASVELIVNDEKVKKVASILKGTEENFVYTEKAGDGILATLDWAMSNGSSLRLESFEEGYWNEK